MLFLCFLGYRNTYCCQLMYSDWQVGSKYSKQDLQKLQLCTRKLVLLLHATENSIFKNSSLTIGLLELYALPLLASFKTTLIIQSEIGFEMVILYCQSTSQIPQTHIRQTLWSKTWESPFFFKGVPNRGDQLYRKEKGYHSKFSCRHIGLNNQNKECWCSCMKFHVKYR